VGHGRSAIYGDTLAHLLAANGYQVQKEYYVNDAGRQMDIVAVSIWLRYLQHYQREITFPGNGYKGDYIGEIAQTLKNDYQEKFLPSAATLNTELLNPKDGDDEQEFNIDALVDYTKDCLGDNYAIILQAGLQSILGSIKEDLNLFGVTFQHWFRESSLKASGALTRAIDYLREEGYLYEQNGATWFNSTALGDDKDRVVIRDNGQTTYFASDIAYLLNKFERGFDRMIYIFGADHHGYIKRLQAAAQALKLDKNKCSILLVQFASLYRGNEKISMSTRSGSFITLKALGDEVGKDAARFFYIMRRCEQHMDFDLDLAKSKSTDNPIYYIQYAHARICSVFKQVKEKQISYNIDEGCKHLDQLTEKYEKELFADLTRYPEMMLAVINHYEPHILANYLRELAADLHSYYNACPFIVADEKMRNARLCLIAAVRQVIQNGLNLLDLNAPESM
jgi:arginyl-tRNA synthetase